MLRRKEIHTDQRYRWWILAIACAVEMMLVINSSIVSAALPATQAELGFSDDGRQWLVTAYVLTLGGLLLFGSRVADLCGLRRALLIGLAGFAAVSVLGGTAGSLSELVAARIGQGLFGALLAPASMSLVTNSFRDSPHQRHAFGAFGAVIGAASTAGLFVGGALTELIGWRSVMYVNVIMTAVSFAGVLFFVRGGTEERRPKLSPVGTLLVTGGLFTIVFGFSRAEVRGWAAPITLTSFAVGLTLVILFFWQEYRSTNPLLPLRFWCNRARGAALLAMFFASAGLFGVVLSLMCYLQLSLHLDPLWAGLAFLPFSAAVILASIVGNSLILPRFSGRTVLVVGSLTAAMGLVILSHIGLHTRYDLVVLPGLIIGGLGKGLLFGASTHGATVGIHPDDSGIASATLNIMHHVGGSMGAALLSTVVASTTAASINKHGPGDPGAVAGYSAAFLVAAGSCLAAAAITLIVCPASRERG